MDATTPNFVGIAKSLTSFKLCATSPNNMQQGVQTEATYNIQQCLGPFARGLIHVLS